MLLVFDVGNTNMVLGIYEGDTLTNSWRINTDHQKSSDEYGILINNLFEYHRINMRDVKNIIISSVVPDVMHSLENFCIKYCGVEPLIVGPGIKTGLNIKYDNPKQVGADRIVNAVAAIEKYGYPLIIVDFGTATTFCAISDKGEYLGGSICPGIKISSEALFHEASKLPRVELAKPGMTICKNTVSAMQAGIIYGYAGMVERLIDMIKKELGSDDVKVIATGGLGRIIYENTDRIDIYDKELTLQGMRLIYEKNKKYPVYWPAMKIRLKNTYIREANKFLPNPCTDSDGIFIDVFIYDYMSNNRFLDFILRIINTILMIVLVFFENLGINLIPIKELYRFNARMYGKLCKNSKYFADEITWSFNPLKPFKYKYSDIYPTKKIKFEDTSFPVPGNYCEYLRKNYGDNYMEPISVEKQVAKHILDINLTSSLPNNNKYKKIWLIYRRGIQIGLIMNVVSLLLLNEASFILSGIGIIIICLAIMIYINEN